MRGRGSIRAQHMFAAEKNERGGGTHGCRSRFRHQKCSKRSPGCEAVIISEALAALRKWPLLAQPKLLQMIFEIRAVDDGCKAFHGGC